MRTSVHEDPPMCSRCSSAQIFCDGTIFCTLMSTTYNSYPKNLSLADGHESNGKTVLIQRTDFFLKRFPTFILETFVFTNAAPYILNF